MSRSDRNALACWAGDPRAAGEFAAAVEALGVAGPSGVAYRALREFVR